MNITFKYRIKDSSSWKQLSKLSSTVNFVWNYCRSTSEKAWRRDRRCLSGFDLNYLTTGSSKLLGISSETIQAIGQQFAKSAKQYRKLPKFRSYRRSLGWIPFKRSVKVINDTVVFNKQRFRFWKSREITGKIKCGSFTQDARGRWYICLVCDIGEPEKQTKDVVGIDLGLKTKLTLSNGEAFDRENITKKFEDKLAKAQRAKKKRLARTIHAKIKNTRADWFHKVSSDITSRFSTVVVGDVKSTDIVKKSKRLAKSTMDAGWFQLKTALRYKAIKLGGEYIEVNEAWTTQICSTCGCISGPKSLSVREWICSDCGVQHNRDLNAAVNILRLGHQAPLRESLLL